MGRDDKYSSEGSETNYSASPFKNADAPAVSESSGDSDDSDSALAAEESVESSDRAVVTAESSESSESTTRASTDEEAASASPSILTRNGVPYAMARSKVTDHRQQKQFQLLKETRFDLQDAVAELVKEYDDENLSETDALEIIVRTGLAHADDFGTQARTLGFGLENIQFSFSE